MKKFLVVIITTFLSLSFVLNFGCKKEEKPAEAPVATVTQKVPETKGTDYYFQRAYKFFLKKDFKALASEIKESEKLLNEETVKATKEGKKVLTVSIDELKRLANDVEAGAVISEKKIKDIFAAAEHAQALHYYLKASEQWTKKESKETGYEMKKAAQHLEQAAKWADYELGIDAVNVINNTRRIADKLIKGSGWVSEEVGKGITEIGNEITKLGKKIMPDKK